MLRTRKNTLTVVGGGWAHPYPAGPFAPWYADGGEGGGSGSGGEGGNAGGSGGTGGEGGGSGEGGGGEDDKLGEGGKKALQTERDARKAAEDRVKELEGKLSRKPKPDDKGGDGKGGPGADADAIKTEIRAEIAAETNARLIRAEVKAAAAGKLADPADAPKFIDLSKIKVGEDGDPDAKQIKKAIEDLLKEKPYLAANGQGWGDVGGGGHSTPPADVEPGMGRLRHAYATESKTK